MSVVVCDRCGTRNRVEPEKTETRRARCGKCGSSLDVSKAVSSGTSGATVDIGKPIMVTDATFARDVLGVRDRPVLVDFWAPWCGPCRAIAPALEQLAAEASGKFLIAKLNVDENPRTAGEFRIQSIPTMVIFKNGAMVDRLIGAQPKQTIAARLSKLS